MLHKARLALTGTTEPRSNVHTRLKWEATSSMEKGRPPKTRATDVAPALASHSSIFDVGPAPQKPMSLIERQDVLASASVLPKKTPYELNLTETGKIDTKAIKRVLSCVTPPVEIDDKLVRIAMSEFKRLSPGEDSVDMNCFDLIMQRIGVNDAWLSHQLFVLFDTDNSTTVDFRSLALYSPPEPKA